VLEVLDRLDLLENILPDDRDRAAILPDFFRTFVAAALSEDADIVVAGEPITGVASWFGPDQPYGREQVAAAFAGYALRIVGARTPAAPP